MLTNIGMVLPEPGFLDAVRQLTREHGALLVMDETHTLSCGPGGYCRANGLQPDVIILGKPIAGGTPGAALPIGLQIAGQRFDDLGVLQMARAFEQLRGPQRDWPQPPMTK